MKYIILSFLLCIASLYFVYKSFDSDQTKFNQNIGKKVVVEKDTLTILDGSMIFQTYTLSNGVKINSNKLDKFLIKK